MSQKKNQYQATFVLDTREREDSIDQLLESLQKEIAALDAEISETENLGRQEFVRVPDPRMPAGTFTRIVFQGSPEVPGKLREALRLNPAVNRVMIQRTN